MSVPSHSSPRLVLISPAKDEAIHIERTIRSVLRQSIRPWKWVVVDDGSTDETPAIVRRYAQRYDWILPLTLHRDAERKPGSAEIQAFYRGYALVRDEPFDFVGKLDTDLEFAPDYFERLLARFEEDPLLGIASGVYLEERGGEWAAVKMPPYHASGASKIVRRQCFVEIGGFPQEPGWDTADEIRAQARGWKTRHFAEIRFCHLRREGSAIGLLHTSFLHGRMYHACGGGALFLLAKAARRCLTGEPKVLAAAALLWGYLQAVLTRRKRIVTPGEARCYRRLLRSQIAGPLARLTTGEGR